MDSLEQLTNALSKSDRVIVFSGAGASAESGLPTFRGGRNSWYESIGGSLIFPLVAMGWGWRTFPWLAWLIYDRFVRRPFINAEPNDFHKWLGHLRTSGYEVYVYTQNVDGLHQKGGLPEECVEESHGTVWYNVCSAPSCKHPIHRETPQSNYEIPSIPACQVCGGGPRPGVLLFKDYFFTSSGPCTFFRNLEYNTCDRTVVLIVGLSGMIGSSDYHIDQIVQRSGNIIYVIDPNESKYTKRFNWISMPAGKVAQIVQNMMK